MDVEEHRDSASPNACPPVDEEICDPFDPPDAEIDAVLALLDKVRGESSTPFARCFNLGNGRLVKQGFYVNDAEARAMEYVRKTTQIPVPRVHMAFRRGQKGYIVMDFVKGQTLTQARMSKPHALHVARQLSAYLVQLEELCSDPHPMGSWPEGPYRNIYFLSSPPECEFHAVDEFHQYWHGRLGPDAVLLLPQDISAGAAQDSTLQHGDLSAYNILVKDGAIVAILDWDTFGWYPRFWDPMIIRRGGWFLKDWMDAADTVFGPITEVMDRYLTVLRKVWADD